MANNKDFKVKNGIQPTVYNEGVGTIVSGSENYSFSGASYDSKSFSVQTQEGNFQDMAFKPDGTKVYAIGFATDAVYQYSLSTAWDISTASYDSVSLSVSSQDLAPIALELNADGTSLYVTGSANDTVFQYNLSTAYDLSTASYASKSFNLSTQNADPKGIVFKSGGTKMYYLAGDTIIYQYSLSTAYDISTVSYDSISHTLSSDTIKSMQFNSDGTAILVCNDTDNTFEKYTLSTAYDITTISATPSETFTATGEATRIKVKPDGSKVYQADSSADTIYQYSTVLNTASLDLSTGAVFDYTPTSDVQVTVSNPAASGTVSAATLLLNQSGIGSYDVANAVYSGKSASVSQDTFPYDVDFNNDGTKMYMFGSTNDTVYEYDLSTAYDVSTATYNSSSFSLSAQDSVGRSIVFKPDGTKLYYVGANADNVYQYSLSTAWDISTASYDSVSFYVGTQDGIPTGITFNNDGTKFYITGLTNDTVYQYSMSTAYNMSTASYDSVSFSVTSQAPLPYGIQFNSDGTKMYILDANNDSIYQYSLSTAFNVSTASYDSVSFSVETQEATPYGFTFADSGTKIYVVGGTADTVFQYTAKSPATITYDTTLEWAGGTAPTSPAVGETDVITISTRDGGTTYQAIQAIDGAK